MNLYIDTEKHFCTFIEFVIVNTDPDGIPIEPIHLHKIAMLNVGEFYTIDNGSAGITKVIRIPDTITMEWISYYYNQL